MAAGTDPFYLVDAGVAAAAALSGGAKPRAHKRLPPSLDAFGWCTWDAFYSTVSARGLAEGLGSLQSGGVFPRLLIIDDGWQLTDVDAPYSKAPTSQLADKMKVKGAAKEFVETTQVGVWVCVCAGWGGFAAAAGCGVGGRAACPPSPECPAPSAPARDRSPQPTSRA